MAPQADSLLKLDWAERQLQGLKGSIGGFVTSDAFTFRWQRKTDPNKYALLAKVARPCPPEWGLLVGDIANNMRSAIEYAIDRLSGLAPDDRDRRSLGFPICIAPDEFKKQTPRFLNQVDAAAIAIIESFQPYNGSGVDDSLYHLQHINNGDKHRAIRVISARGQFRGTGFSGRVGTNISYGWKGPAFGVIDSLGTVNFGGGTTVASVGTGEISDVESEVQELTVGPGTAMTASPQMTPLIRFADGQPVIERREVLVTLDRILVRVREVVSKFP